ncbi:SH3 domain and PTB/PI domain and Tensin phosphotyrosine-binding domain-containing protein [Strongyloides ratti]|uniref:SH3 domain and PTB/PI domain and Tensin phosphotyrosine-binding domain-containing protein n=1 Tax=Strongyloides ratti TaxID=34506 RepID=A0A090LSV7_STRRB|nr:SH3 domain and PTB/PI domain and Tensin phosphotyrosine-binding domain-containing protein [Strongyloides ratti]CEF71282.1 SH3 domain and PTB/PI domain and Tensin phosphotyrosine-binding domain-containing protein [Strongyloides ratti]
MNYSRGPSMGQHPINSVPSSPKGFGSRSGSAISLPNRGNIPPNMYGQLPPNSVRRRGPSVDPNDNNPSYSVEHLATFAVGRQFGLQSPGDGVRKLKQMERNSAIWAQPMILKLTPQVVSVEDENGDLVEQFPMDLVRDPTSHQSNDSQDLYNNILIFIVNEDIRSGRKGANPTEMHIFQCTRVSAREVANDMILYLQGKYDRVKGGRRDTNLSYNTNYAPLPKNMYNGDYRLPPQSQQQQQQPPINQDDFFEDGTELFECDVNTLNHCFDDIERFVARIQSAALAQREIELQQQRLKSQRNSSKSRFASNPIEIQNGILQLRAQVPHQQEFYEVLQKFKLSFNLLAKLKGHIHEPNAPELLHFLFTPLTVILDASKWGLGRNIAEQVISPLISREAKELLHNCLTSKEIDVWMSLGNAWRIPPEEWNGPLPIPYRPVFMDGFAPYGIAQSGNNDYHTSRQYSGIQMSGTNTPVPIHRGVSAPPLKTSGNYNSYYGPQQRTAPYTNGMVPPSRSVSREHSVDNTLEIERMKLEQEKLRFEQEKIRERERRLREDEERLRKEEEKLRRERMKQEEMHLKEMYENHSVNSEGGNYGTRATYVSPLQHTNGSVVSKRSSSEFKAPSNGGTPRNSTTASIYQQRPQSYTNINEQNPRQLEYGEELLERGAKIVQVTHDRLSGHEKELTVSRGELLELLNDQKNWWQCRNANNKIGFVPKTILATVSIPGGLEESPSNLKEQTLKEYHETIENEYLTKAINNDNRSKSMSNIEIDRLEKNYNSKKNSKEQNDYDDSELSSTLERAFMKQLHDTICKLDYKKLNTYQGSDYNDNICITVKSTEEDLQNWLIAKGFSRKIVKMFGKCNGRNVFLLEKDVFKKYCGKEADRLYSLLLIEKNRSGYKSYTSRELELLLQHRKCKTEKDNDGDNSEPLQRPPSVLQITDFSEDDETDYDEVEQIILNNSNTNEKCFHVRQISLDSISNNSYEYQKADRINHKNNNTTFKEVYERYKVANDFSQNENNKSHLIAAYY